ncbi:MAG: type II toxin-antitoxin system RelE/ParE family toxin [Micropepsaceae bacterium]
MSRPAAGWSVRLSDLAERDVRDIAVWTHNTFGTVQAERYSDALSLTLERLLGGPHVAGVRERLEISKGLFSLRVRVKRRQGRHSIFFRVDQGEILIVRILHDAMDLDRQLVDE